MAYKVKNAVKNGMGGSRCGKGRTEKTATMKRQSKKIRRRMAKALEAEGFCNAARISARTTSQSQAWTNAE